MLTDEDLRIAGGDMELLAIRIVERYGIAKQWADCQIAEWLNALATQTTANDLEVFAQTG